MLSEEKQYTEDNKSEKTVTKHIWDEYLDKTENIRHTPEFKALYKKKRNNRAYVCGHKREISRVLPTIFICLQKKTAVPNFKYTQRITGQDSGKRI